MFVCSRLNPSIIENSSDAPATSVPGDESVLPSGSPVSTALSVLPSGSPVSTALSVTPSLTDQSVSQKQPEPVILSNRDKPVVDAPIPSPSDSEPKNCDDVPGEQDGSEDVKASVDKDVIQDSEQMINVPEDVPMSQRESCDRIFTASSALKSHIDERHHDYNDVSYDETPESISGTYFFVH